MNRFTCSVLLSPLALISTLLITRPGLSGEVPTTPTITNGLQSLSSETNSLGSEPVEQVTSVSQLTDVKPTDWAFQALQSLVERYGCIVGYPDRTFRGNQALTRYEFAAGLNACLDRMSELIASSTANLVKKEDLLAAQRLQEEFAAELAALRGRVDALETRTATLEKQQFSTTTKLLGEALFAVSGIVAGDNAQGQRIDRTTTLGDRVRLNFESSFTGKDLLRTRLQALNIEAFSGSSTFYPMGDFRFAGGAFATGNNNSVAIDQLLYTSPIGNSTNIAIDANAGAIDDWTDTVNPFLDGDGSSGVLTHFGMRNAIYYLLNGTGGGIRQKFGKAIELSLGYLSNNAANPNSGGGFFKSAYGASAQLTIRPTENLTVGLTYIHGYNVDFLANGSTGTNRASLRTALLNNPNLPTELSPYAGLDVPTSSNAYGFEASFRISPQVVLNGSVGYVNTRTLSSLGGELPRGSLDIWTWFVGLAFPDLGSKGSLGGIVVGMEPRAAGVSPGLRSVIGRDNNTSLHVQGFYQYQITDNIAVTPGIIWITSPDGNSNNANNVIGAVRTTFTF